MKNLPTAPFPTVGEIVYDIAIRSGLVQTTNDKDPLYNGLKAFKDDRKRPALAPIEFPKTVLRDLEDRIVSFINVDKTESEVFALLTIKSITDCLSHYSGFVASRDASLLERKQMVEEVLWPTLFSMYSSFFLTLFNEWKPYLNLQELVKAENPLGLYLNHICPNGTKDFNTICNYRSINNIDRPIDSANARKTLNEWINGANVPNLDRCQEILEALELNDKLDARIWMLLARLLQKTPMQYRQHILHRMTNNEGSDVVVQAHLLIRNLAWNISTELNIGADRPYAKIQAALYESDAESRSREHIVDMLIRQENTWKPIHNQTQHLIHWMWARLHVLCGEYREGLDRYQHAYDYGANRDPDIYNKTIHEAMTLALFMNEERTAEKYRGWIGLYSSFDWDETKESVSDRFDKIFPPNLRFPKAN